MPNELQTRAIEDDDDIFADLPPLSVSDVKKQTIAAELAALLAHSNVSRSEIAVRLKWNKSRVTKFLSGEANLTLSKISEFTCELGHDFDMILRPFGEARVAQPWQKRASEELSQTVVPEQYVLLHYQTGDEVARDVYSGLAKKWYVSSAPNTGARENHYVLQMNNTPTAAFILDDFETIQSSNTYTHGVRTNEQ